MKLHITFILGFLVFLSSPLHSKSDIRIDDRLPAGNIVFEKIINDTVYIHQDMRGADKVWFYWGFRVRGAQGKKLTFAFTKSDVVGSRGPVISTDRGKTYDYLAEKGAGKRTFTYEFPDDAKEAGIAVMGTGRSDYPNQINNVLAFPGVFRGALDVRASEINEEMKVAAAYAIANSVSDEDLNPENIIPKAFDLKVQSLVAEAVKEAAIKSGVAQI